MSDGLSNKLTWDPNSKPIDVSGFENQIKDIRTKIRQIDTDLLKIGGSLGEKFLQIEAKLKKLEKSIEMLKEDKTE